MGRRRRTLLATLVACATCIAGVALVAPAGAIKRSRWLKSVSITEYWPARESWGVGRKVDVPGIRASLRVDFLYSAWGMSMEGDGLGEDGRRYHIDSIGSQGWVTEKGKRTLAADGFRNGPPFWRAAGWRNRRGHVTFALAGGGWSNGKPKKYIPPRGITFAKGPSLDIDFWRSVAVDPDVIPLGSWVWVPDYRGKPGGGWMKAEDTGGAINGRAIDVYREPPRDPYGGSSDPNAKVYVVPPGEQRPDGRPPRPR